MTTFSIGDWFNELVKETLPEKQVFTEQTDNNVEMIDESAKSQNLFQDNKPPGKKHTTTRIKSKNFCQTLLMLELIKKISTMKILFSMFIYW